MTTNDDIITRPGKFEGERAIVERAYAVWMHGLADSDDGDHIVVTIEGETVHFRIHDDGFVMEVAP